MSLKAEADALAGVVRAKRALVGRARRGASAVQVAERWRPYRSLAVSYLFASESEIGT
jgi:3-methyladenine DNA glycosylase/8-oxoguanine DNA glycosylase